MKELDYLDSSGSDLGIQYDATLSKLQDLDIVKAISQYATQQTTLEAAQKSFKTMSSLSLFNYIG
jgi:flagellar hook-associated protein 3 FlgL